MAYGALGFASLGTPQQASPSIWADCGNNLLNDLGLGYFIDQHFLGDNNSPANTAVAGGIQTFSGTGTAVYGNASSATFGPNVESMATPATDNANTAIYGEELGQIIRNSGQPLWFETRIAFTALGDEAVFVGVANRAAIVTATTGILADNPSNSVAADFISGSASAVGFITKQASSAVATVNAVYRKTTGTTVTVLADVTNATALQAEQSAQPAGVVITQAAGVTAQTTAPLGEGIQIAYGNLVAASFRKFGVRFDGQTTLYFYVDGVLVAKQDVDSTVDQTTYYAPVVALKAGTATAQTINVDFVRAAYQARG